MPHVILFVDDEPDVLDLLRRTFPAADGYDAVTAQDADEALGVLAARDVDLLVTDQRMPGMTGVELVERARTLRPELCAILLTAYTEPRDIVAAINRGQVYRYVVKPWDTTDLRQTVRGALEQVSLRRERARLQVEAERRLVALQAASQLAREVGAAEGNARLLERVVERLPSIVPCDVAAALLAKGDAPTLIIRPVADLPDRALLAVKEHALAAYREHAGVEVGEGALNVTVAGGGRGARPEAFASRLTLPVEIGGAIAGVVLVESAAEEAFTEGDARVLDVLVNEMAESLRALAGRMAGERERLERVVESMADGLLYAERGSDEAVANPAARRLLGAPREGPIRTEWLAGVLGFHPLDPLRAGPAAGAATTEIRVGERTVACAVSAVAERSGRTAGVAVVLRDVTEEKRLDERKQEFVHVVSHELRTPLTSITGALDVVLGGLVGELEPRQGRYLRMARDSAHRLNAIVDDLLDLARLGKGKLRIQPDVVFLDALVRSAVERWQAAAAERGHELSVETQPDPVRLVADGARIGQVLGNLLGNAVKFAPPNGVIRVRVARSSAVSCVAGFTVWNSGEGIPEDDLERIFERFEQARNDRTRQVPGTGLGLSISRGLVEAHGGSIWAESRPGEGVRFAVVLPVEPAAEPAERQPIRADAPGALVVDDADTALLVGGVLRGAGIPSRHAETAEDAVALARRHRPGVVLWDPLLPALAGVPLAGIIRHDAETRRAALLAVSPPLGREAAFRSGADAFLEKPVAPAALAETAAGLLRGGRPAGARVLVVDDDPDIRAICAAVLGGHGYAVDEAESCARARQLVLERRPQVVLVDVALPDGDGFSLLEGLAEARAAEPFAAVFVTARGEVADKVRGLKLGADDYLTKPFDAEELVARVDAVLRRREAALAASPMTRLPGGRAIDREVERRLEAKVPFALSYVDLDNLKAYNDTYGYAKADGVVLQTAGILRDVVAHRGGEHAFLGHVGGDDFVLLTGADRAGEVCREIIAAFDRVIPLYYDREDRERGYIEAADRYGTRRQFPILSLSIATVLAPPGRFGQHAEIARAAAEVKARAKQIAGSVHLVDEGAGGAAA
ncbi:MAG TPA: response regulator [Anaeromyxobacter sp.]|nr:response regulator [Anaeromyxobacter sp.]